VDIAVNPETRELYDGVQVLEVLEEVLSMNKQNPKILL